MKFIIPLIPVGQKRARKGKFGFYDPQNKIKRELKEWFYAEMIQKGVKMISKVPVEVKMTFHMPIPKSASKTLKNKYRQYCCPHIVKPDIDNIVKFYLDAMSSVVYQDDNCIFSVHATKVYSDQPRTELEVRVYDE